jgi:hypothetical protein
VLPFWVSIGVLSLCQAAVVALPAKWSPARLARLRSAWWALVPAVSVIGFVTVGQIDGHGTATALTYIALVAVPLLAALALGALMHGARPALALLAIPAFALAWADRGALAGEGAAVALSALSCVALGALIAAVTPPRWLALGIVAMALADSALVISDLLQQPNNALNAAHPAADLPRLQYEAFGSAAMGYGDLFVAGLLGGLLASGPSGKFGVGLPGGRSWLRLGGDEARTGGTGESATRLKRWPIEGLLTFNRPARGNTSEFPGWTTRMGDRALQFRGALLVAALAIAFDLLFFAVDELPATVPVALALLILWSRGSPLGSSSSAGRPESSWRGLASTGVGAVNSRSDLAPASSIRRSCGTTRPSNDPTASL